MPAPPTIRLQRVAGVWKWTSIIKGRFIYLDGVNSIFPLQSLFCKLLLNILHVQRKSSTSGSVHRQHAFEGFRISSAVSPLRKREPLGGVSQTRAGMRRCFHRRRHFAQPIAKSGNRERRRFGSIWESWQSYGTSAYAISRSIPLAKKHARSLPIGAIGNMGVGCDAFVLFSDCHVDLVPLCWRVCMTPRATVASTQCMPCVQGARDS